MKKRLKKKIMSSYMVLDKKRLTGRYANTAYGRLLQYSRNFTNIDAKYERPKFNTNRHYYIVSYDHNNCGDYEFWTIRAKDFESLTLDEKIKGSYNE